MRMSDRARFNVDRARGFEQNLRPAGKFIVEHFDANGNATINSELDLITVTPGPMSVVGRGLIVHAQPDDFKTQPTGNAGARSACSVIQASK